MSCRKIKREYIHIIKCFLNSFNDIKYLKCNENRHFKFVIYNINDGNKRFIVASKTPSCNRWAKNFKKDLCKAVGSIGVSPNRS